MQWSTVRRQKSGRREPQTAAVGQSQQPLLCGAADGMLADQIGALVAKECRREQLRASGGAGINEEGRRQGDAAVTAACGDRFFVSAARLLHRERAAWHEQLGERNAAVERT